MENGWKWTLASCVALVFGAMFIIGSKKPSEEAKPAHQVAAVVYPAPQVEVEAQPMLASYDDSAKIADEAPVDERETDRSKKRHGHHHRSHSKKAEAAKDLGADPDMGFMAADDSSSTKASSDTEPSEASSSQDWTPRDDNQGDQNSNPEPPPSDSGG